MYYTDEKLDKIEDYLEDTLPHGSGIDAKWEFDYQKNGAILAICSYHCMDNHGYYCGWQDFKVKFAAGEPLVDFTLHFTGGDYLSRKNMLRDYLEDTLRYSISIGYCPTIESIIGGGIKC